MRIGIQQLLILAAIIIIIIVIIVVSKGNSNKRKEDARSSTESNIDRLTHLNELLEKGIITREEFDAKKKQILGL